MRLFGLIGFPLGHSFSRRYFSEKFREEGLADCRYELFPIASLTELPALLEAHPDLEGFNVTIPHKVGILACLDHIDPAAREIGAVNTVAVRDGALWGYNTDAWGLEQSLCNFLPAGFGSRALILGTGGASRAAQHVLRKMNISFTLVSRAPAPGVLPYEALDARVLSAHRLIIQTTPLGMYPDVDSCPPIPFSNLSENHYLYDLVYNPAETLFLQRGAQMGCRVKNGLEMLHLQADKAWDIWNSRPPLDGNSSN
jgi:shikimate dehydrogenase